MYLESTLFFAFRLYLHPNDNVSVDSNTTLPSRVLFFFSDELYIAPNRKQITEKSRTMLYMFARVFGTILLSGAMMGYAIMYTKRKTAIKMLIYGTDGIDHVPLLFDDGSSNLVTDEENNKQGSWFT